MKYIILFVIIIAAVFLVDMIAESLIFITGDLVSRTETDLGKAERLLDELCKTAPVYICLGNHEQSMPEPYYSRIIAIFEKSSAVLLRNESTHVSIKGREFTLSCYEPDYTTYKKNEAYNDLDRFTSEDIEAAIGRCGEGLNLMLEHNPFFAEEYSKWGADFTFSGHVHGGVVRLFGRGMLSPERKFLPRYSKGKYTVGNMQLHVSAGLGKLRIFDPPEIVVYD